MAHFIGLDVGGTKIAGGVFTSDGVLLHEKVIPTPREYEQFIQNTATIISDLEAKVRETCTVGLSLVGTIDHEARTVYTRNMPCISGLPVFDDLEKACKRSIRFANDANCAALAEAVDGAGAMQPIVLGLIMGTGVGSGLIINQKIIEGPNGLTGEIGQMVLPCREEEDGPTQESPYGVVGDVESSIQGAALTRLYAFMHGEPKEPPEIADAARAGDEKALATLDRYYEVVAKAMSAIVYSIDPHVIVVSGGLNSLPGMYEEVPKRMPKYCGKEKLKTKFTPAVHGPMAGMRGAAMLWWDEQ